VDIPLFAAGAVPNGKFGLGVILADVDAAAAARLRERGDAGHN
jgi:hypothetical protein